MKKIMLAMLLVFSTVNAAWEDHWVEGVKACYEKRYEDAEMFFTCAITELQGDSQHAHVYIDRGRLYLLLERDEEALTDIEKGLSYNLQGEDQLRAIVSKVTVLYRLGRYEEAEEARAILRTLQHSPQLEVYETKVIIRNVPDCECSKLILRQYLANNFCNSIDDVVVENGIIIANRTKKCDCVSADSSVRTIMAFTECEYWCDRLYKTCSLFCTSRFKTFKCQAICLGVVDTLRDGCFWCCKGGNAYKKCVQPFEDVVGQMGKVCDPAWD